MQGSNTPIDVEILKCFPIKITENLLLSVGFMKIVDRYILEFDNYQITVKQEADEDFILQIGLGVDTIHIKYIHELQQIFKSHKIAKQIDLSENNCWSYRVGNIVRYKKELYKIASIENADSTYARYLIVNENDLHKPSPLTVSVDELQPIEIENVWLEENNFQYNEDNNNYEIFDMNCETPYDMSKNLNNVWSISNLLYNNESYTFDGHIHYIHVLQNILNKLELKFKFDYRHYFYK